MAPLILAYRCRVPGKSVRIDRPGCHACSKATVGGALRSHRLMLGAKLNYHSYYVLGCEPPVLTLLSSSGVSSPD